MNGGLILLAIGVAIIAMSTSINGQCVQSLTTVSGRNAPKGRICAKSLIFNENFDRFDMNLWQHEHTMYGGGVSQHKKATNNLVNLIFVFIIVN